MKLPARLLPALLLCACASVDPSPRPESTVLPAPAEPPPVRTLPPPVDASATLSIPSSTPEAPPPTPRTPEPAPADPTLSGPLRDLLDDWRAEDGSPGAVLGVRLADGRTALVASGRTDEGGGVRVEPGHRFRVGSITKSFVATLVVQLAQDGLLGLDDRLNAHVAWAPHAEDVTVRQLLQHTSGMPDFASVPAYRQRLLADAGRTWQPRETVELIADRQLAFEPGTRWAYSNTNYVLAGLVAESVAGVPLAQLLRERIFEPLGLASSFLEGVEAAPPIETAGHYDLDGDGHPENVRVIPYTALVTSAAAAGGLSSTGLDILDFATEVFDGRLLDDDGLAEVLSRSRASRGYGLGIARYREQGRELWGHAGALPGYSAFFATVPAEGISVVALANETGADLRPLVEEAFELALELRTAGRWSTRAAAALGWGAAAPDRPRLHCWTRCQAG